MTVFNLTYEAEMETDFIELDLINVRVNNIDIALDHFDYVTEIPNIFSKKNGSYWYWWWRHHTCDI